MGIVAVPTGFHAPRREADDEMPRVDQREDHHWQQQHQHQQQQGHQDEQERYKHACSAKLHCLMQRFSSRASWIGQVETQRTPGQSRNRLLGLLVSDDRHFSCSRCGCPWPVSRHDLCLRLSLLGPAAIEDLCDLYNMSFISWQAFVDMFVQGRAPVVLAKRLLDLSHPALRHAPQNASSGPRLLPLVSKDIREFESRSRGMETQESFWLSSREIPAPWKGREWEDRPPPQFPADFHLDIYLAARADDSPAGSDLEEVRARHVLPLVQSDGCSTHPVSPQPFPRTPPAINLVPCTTWHGWPG